MAKKRKATGRNVSGASTGPKDVDPADARLGPITTYEDVADSEDEYFINNDKIMLDDEPHSKRRKQDDSDIELSDEEVLGFDDGSSDEDESDQDAEAAEADEDGEADNAWWGSSKSEYYNADNIETEADAAAEETEAKRLQKKKLSKMAEEDFIFDADEWRAGDEDETHDDDNAVTEILKDIEITDDMGPHDRKKLLDSRFPEFEHLVNDFQQLQSVLAGLRKEAQASKPNSVETIKYWVLGCYIAAVASYFAILTSPARDSAKEEKTLEPTELRDHEVMETLVSCRSAWEKVRHMRSLNMERGVALEERDAETIQQDILGQQSIPALKAKSTKKLKATAAKHAQKREKAKEVEASLADLYDMSNSQRNSKKRVKTPSSRDDDDHSDFGEEDALDARAAADKAARKKSLKFYTSQIAQKTNRRTGAGRDAGGDMDIPHRERLRDRQARLLAEAEKRGKKGSKRGADLGDDRDDDDDTAAANSIRNNENEYYDMVANSSKRKKEDKAARYAAYAAASKADRVVENEEIGEDGKRKITYAIEKNKGLTPKRSKDVRNPRVKKRKQFEAKKKKLSSMKPVWKGGEPKGGYQGELSGINIGVVKSVKL